MNFRHHLSLLLFFVLALTVNSSRAALIEFTPHVSGEITTGGGIFTPTFASHSRPLTSLRGWVPTQNFVRYSSYLVFDTAGMGFTPEHATLLLDIVDTSASEAGLGPLEFWGLDTFTAADYRALPEGSLDHTLASSMSFDLRGGTSLAPSIIGPDGLVSIELNSTALAQITSANGLWGIGLYDNRPVPPFFAGLALQSAPRLILSNASIPQPVPAPGTTLLVLVGLGMMASRRRR